MGKIVVAKLYRLGKDGDKFKQEFKKVLRNRVVVDEDYVKTFNKSTEVSGQMYEIDKEATEARDVELKAKTGKKVEKADPDAEMIEFLEGLTLDQLREYAIGSGITEESLGAKKEKAIIKLILANK
jgi:hypothetical protein